MRLRPAFRVEQIHPDTLDYRSRLISNGGTISDLDLTAVDVFVKEVYGNGLRSLLLDVSPLGGDNLAAALTKLWYPSGVQGNLANTNFVGADYTQTAGLKGNGMTKYLNTGFTPGSFLSQSVSLGVYNRSNVSEIGADISVNNADRSQTINLFSKWIDGITYFDSFNSTAGQGRVTVSMANPTGLLTGSRVSATDSKIYLNTNQVATIATSGGSPSTGFPIWYFAFNDAGNPIAFSSKFSGFFYIGLGLTATQVSTLYRLVQNLMTAFGRQV